MRRIALLTPLLTTADAISNDLYGMQAVLKEHGHDARLFANESMTKDVDVPPAGKVKEFLRSPDDLLIYHYSMGWNFGLNLLQTECQSRSSCNRLKLLCLSRTSPGRDGGSGRSYIAFSAGISAQCQAE